MSEAKPPLPTNIKQECLKCHNSTNHAVHAKIDRTDRDENTDATLWTSYLIIQCKGCDAIYFRKESTFSDDIDYDQNGCGGMATKVECFHEEQVRVDGLYLNDDVWSIPDIIQTIYKETLAAIQRKLFTLAGIGVRAIIEAVCKHQKTAGRDLFKKIDNLVVQGLLTSSGAKILHSIRLLGNDAAHEIKAPTQKQIIAAMKVIDHLLLGTYVLPEEAKVLPAYTPAPPKAAAAVAPAKVKGASK